MPRQHTPENTLVERGDWKLAYNNEFRDLLRKNRGVIEAGIRLADEAVRDYDPESVKIGNREVRYDKQSNLWLAEEQLWDPKSKDHKAISGGWKPMNFGRWMILVPGKPYKDEKTGLEVTVLGRSNREIPVSTDRKRVDVGDYFKFDYKNKGYFVKRNFVTINPGFVEFQNTMSARELLKDLDFVRVVEARLGYQDETQSWFVSDMESLEKAGFSPYSMIRGFDDYGKLSDPDWLFTGSETAEEFTQREARYKLIQSRMAPYKIGHDLGSNLFYNRTTGQFILIDVTGPYGRGETSGLGKPIRELK